MTRGMVADWENAYREAFYSIYKKITAGASLIDHAKVLLPDDDFSDISSGTFPDRLPDPEILVKLYTGTLNAGRKKSLGVFYTPPEVVRFMCRESLAHYLSNSAGISFEQALELMGRLTNEGQDSGEGKDGQDRRERPEGQDGTEEPDGKGSRGNRDSLKVDHGLLARADKALETVRIFDPAAGCGAFICGMLEEIADLRHAIARLSGEGYGYAGNGSAQNHPFMMKYNTITNSIHGADIDATAVEITRLRLWYGLIAEFRRYRDETAAAAVMAARETGDITEIPASGDFRCNVVCADSLFDHDVCGFDIVIGNPPYVSAVEAARSGRGTRHALKNKFPQLKGAFDIYAAFLLDGIRRISERGVYCWIVPNRLLVSQYAVPVLEHLKENGLRYTISISDIRVFSGVGVYPVIVTGNRCKPAGDENTGPERSEVNVKDDRGPEGFRQYAAGSLQQLGARCFVIKSKVKQYETFADHNIKIASGIAGFQAGMLKQYIKEAPCESGKSVQVNKAVQAGDPVSAGCGVCSGCSGYIPFAVSGSIDRYSLDRSKVRYMGTTYENPCIRKDGEISGRRWKLWCSEKICIAGMTRELEAYYSREPLALGVGTYAVYGFGDIDPYYLLALLNSRFMSWYLRERFYERHLAGGYLAVNKNVLEQLPLVRADRKTEQEIARRAEKLQRSSCSGVMAKRLLGEIDEMVFMIYGHKFIP